MGWRPTLGYRLSVGLVCIGAFCLAPLVARALPMGSQGTWMVMGDRTSDFAKLSANYAFTRNDALGFTVGRWDEQGHAGAPSNHRYRRDFSGLTYTRLLQRWNLPDAQANLWLVGTVGSAQRSEQSGTNPMGALAVLADYETTRLYTGAGIELKRAGVLRHDVSYARAGFSFHEVEYEETQPWLIVEAKRERYSASSTSATLLKSAATAMAR